MADYIRTLAAGDADLLAVADSVAVAEGRVLDQIGADVERGAGITGTVPTTAGSTAVGQVTESTVAAPALAVGRGFAVGAQATESGLRPFAGIGLVNAALSAIFSGLVPPGAELAARKSPPTTISDEGATVTGSIGLGVKADGEATFGMDFDVKIDRAAKSGEAGAKGVEAAKGSASLGFEATANPCPDANGTVNITFRAKLGADITAGAKSAIGTTEVSGTAVVNVDDSASITGFDIDARQQSSGTNAAGTGTFVDSSASLRLDLKGDNPSRTITGGKLNRESQAVGFAERNRLHEDGMNKAADFVRGYAVALEVYWKGGRCVKVVASSPGRVKPGTVSPVQVSVVHKLEGKPLAVPVDATLSGPQSIDITRIERSPGTITHTASQDPKSAATIDLISTSRRGIGKATVSITVGGLSYVASGGGARISVSGTVEELASPFTLTGKGSGFTVEFKYVPGDATGRSGTVSYSGSGGGAKLTGTGTYTVTGEEGGVLQMSVTTKGCADIGGCRTNTENVTLTPTT